jgi:hypothetical protein
MGPTGIAVWFIANSRAACCFTLCMTDAVSRRQFAKPVEKILVN